MTAYTRAKVVSDGLPDYPGRGALEVLFRPVVEPLAKRYAGHKVQRLLGFWLCWQTMGGHEGLLASGLWSRTVVYNSQHEFEAVFGSPVEQWMPHLALALVEADRAHGEQQQRVPVAEPGLAG